nr:hypothetical protein [Tanacetum cinerariifolium]
MLVESDYESWMIRIKRQCKEKNRVKDSQCFKDKMLLMEAKEKGAVLDAETKAFLADVECTAPYDQPLAITTINIFEISHEDAYDSDVDEGPHAATTFMAICHPQVEQMEEHLDSDVESDIDDNTISYHQYQLDSEVQDVPTEAKISQPTLYDGHALLKPTNTPVGVHDSEESLVQAEELSREQVYWLPAEELATQKINPPKPVTPFVHTRPASNRPLSEELSSNCVRENLKVIELEAVILKQQQMLAKSDKRCSFIQKNHIDLQIKFRNYKECLKNQTIGDNSHSSTVNTVFEINQLKEQLQRKDDTIRKLQTQINSMSMLNVEPTVGSFDKQALETELTQLKDAITSVRIQNDGFKLTALTAENTKLKSESISKMHSKPIVPEKPKVLDPWMYAISSKYIVPLRRVNRAEPTPLPKKKQATFQEPPRPSNRPTQKIVVQQNKKLDIHVNLSTGVKPATGASKPMSKSDTRNHSTLLAKHEIARRVEDHHRNLNKQNMLILI